MKLSTNEKMKADVKEKLIQALTFDYKTIRNSIKKEFFIKNNSKVLDIGCGTGIHCEFLKVKNYLGIDIDKRLIAYAKQKYKNKEFKVMDATRLNFEKNSFDNVLIVGVIHHLSNENAKKVCKGIQKVLKNESNILVIEAIPPLSKWNLLGAFLRSRDEGKFIRLTNEYKNLFSKFFTVKKAYSIPGGLFDYGVFLLEN